MDGMKKVPVREQEPKVRATNFEEVCYGYNEEEAVAEASRCLNCKNARCVQGCPVKIDIPAFVKEVKAKLWKRDLMPLIWWPVWGNIFGMSWWPKIRQRYSYWKSVPAYGNGI